MRLKNRVLHFVLFELTLNRNTPLLAAVLDGGSRLELKQFSQ